MNELPLFYKNPVVFDVTTHAGLSFPDNAPNYMFAARADAIPVLATELAQAVKSYPVVFLPTPTGVPVLVALMGLGDGVNTFVNSRGQWRSEAYIPAYVRRYPFLPMRASEGSDPLLGIDLSEGWVRRTGDVPLVDGEGKPTERLLRVMQFQKEYLQQADLTQRLCTVLAEASLLEPATLTWNKESNDVHQLNGFLRIDEARLRGLSDSAVGTLHREDAFGLVYAHLLSLSNFKVLAEAAEKKSGKTPKTD